MNPPPRWPWTDPADALDALVHGTYALRARRWADRMDTWLATPRPPLGRHSPGFPRVEHDQQKAA